MAKKESISKWWGPALGLVIGLVVGAEVAWEADGEIGVMQPTIGAVIGLLGGCVVLLNDMLRGK